MKSKVRLHLLRIHLKAGIRKKDFKYFYNDYLAKKVFFVENVGGATDGALISMQNFNKNMTSIITAVVNRMLQYCWKQNWYVVNMKLQYAANKMKQPKTSLKNPRLRPISEDM